jgi:hypothetical protein
VDPSGEAIRLFHRGQHPPLRGTMLSLDDQRNELASERARTASDLDA